jgi:hypothetical protein
MENRIIKDKKDLFMEVIIPQEWRRRKWIERSSIAAKKVLWASCPQN